MSALQKHGADSYLEDGRSSGALDFSSTVVAVPPPLDWKKKLSSRLESLRLYPQPYAHGLTRYLEKRLGLPAGSVLVGNGSSEVLGWIAQSLRGKRVLLEAPCFGEYAVWLSRHQALIREIGADEPWSPEWQRLKKFVAKSQSFWLADPANPSGLKMTPEELRERAQFCRKRNVLLVLDEAIRAQALKDPGDLGLKLATRQPGMLLVRSLSKGLGLPGLRLGYVAGHPKEIARLGAFVDPWNVSSLAQAAGAWIFDEERRLAASRRKTLQAWKKDLLARMDTLPSGVMKARESDTGFFLVRLLGKFDDSRRLVTAMAKRGMLLRSCASYGGWGTGNLRLNPRAPRDNARLLAALKGFYASQ
jgi:threonine-phosphate decarboxylase